ncbi:two-component sensor histidine kinase BarA [Candidatus Fukatsuia endosymbiont of Tuberolachnus salignus]|uniref:two-component sensor histidine kinase BarA n=1 Tax=Candidatus Fukatsuia endosymbiont of Tuberolachnus salignus TaxID=3077957 RepID=UPI00313BF443
MTKYSLRTRMMVLILAPTLLLGLLLSTSFMINRYNDLENQVVSAGTGIIEPLAVASEYGMTFRNRDAMRQLINLLHRRHSDIVRSIAVFDADNKLFVTSNYNYNSSQLRLKLPVFHSLILTKRGNSLLLQMPIVSESYLSRDHLPPNDPRANMAPHSLGYIAIDLDLQAAHSQQFKEVLIAVLLLLFCLGVAMLFAYRLMLDVTEPIRNMVNTVDHIRRGQLDSRVAGSMLGELDMLKNGINSMAMSLAAYHEEMQQNVDQATSDLLETLEQMEIQNVELELAKKRAQEAARIKSEFLANISHELRTPLNGVIGFTRQTLKTSLTPTQIDYLQTIQRSANNLLAIINDVLDFSKLEAGKLILEQIPFLLRTTLDEVIILLAHTAHEKGLELILHVNNDVPNHLVGDSMRLQQIITNLLGNAIKFTEKGNISIWVKVSSQTEGNVRLTIEIHDTGIGISEAQYPRLFQAFGQADASISRRHGGTDLGLTITERLVQEMDGNINFSSQLNHGSIFKFDITLAVNENMSHQPISMKSLVGKHLAYIESNPLAAQATLHILDNTPLHLTHSLNLEQLPKQHYDFLLVGVSLNTVDHQDKLITALGLADQVILALPSQSQVDAEQLKQMGAKACMIKPISANRLFPLLLSENSICYLTQQKEQPIRQRLPFRVMAVDDNPANLKLIGTLLEEQVTETILCESGSKALAIAEKMALDIILMDIQMPGMDGIRASELIHKIPQHQNTPIIAVTAHAVSGQREHFLKMGMVDYLAKPIDEAQLTLALSGYHLSHYPSFHRDCGQALPGYDQVDSQETTEQTTIQLHTESTLKSLDWSLAVQHAANKEDLAHDLLRMLLELLPQVTLCVQAIVDDEKTPMISDEDFLSLIHKLHGSCAYCGVPRLKQICFTIEQQLRRQLDLQSLQPEWLELLDEIDNVTQAARLHL